VAGKLPVGYGSGSSCGKGSASRFSSGRTERAASAVVDAQETGASPFGVGEEPAGLLFFGGRLRRRVRVGRGGKRLRHESAGRETARCRGDSAVRISRRWIQAHRPRNEAGEATTLGDTHFSRAGAARQLRSRAGTLQLNREQLSRCVSCHPRGHSWHVIGHKEGMLVLRGFCSAGTGAGQLLIGSAYVETSAVSGARTGELLQL
jgi:hypothetical protein